MRVNKPLYAQRQHSKWSSVKCSIRILILAAILTGAYPALASELPGVPENIAPHPAPEQPLPFSHKTHLKLPLQCLSCHINPNPGVLMTFPATETCIGCHQGMPADQPTLAKLRDFADSNQAIPWVRVYTLMPGVSWGHRTHLNAGKQCVSCHGDVSESTEISESKAILSMATCISCHQSSGAPVACVLCHAWPTDSDLGLVEQNAAGKNE